MAMHRRECRRDSVLRLLINYQDVSIMEQRTFAGIACVIEGCSSSCDSTYVHVRWGNESDKQSWQTDFPHKMTAPPPEIGQFILSYSRSVLYRFLRGVTAGFLRWNASGAHQGPICGKCCTLL